MLKNGSQQGFKEFFVKRDRDCARVGSVRIRGPHRNSCKLAGAGRTQEIERGHRAKQQASNKYEYVLHLIYLGDAVAAGEGDEAAPAFMLDIIALRIDATALVNASICCRTFSGATCE